MDIDASLVPNLARLSRLDTQPAEEKHLTEQLPKILTYVGQLGEVATEIVPEQRDASAPLRDDVSRPSKTVEHILEQAPERADRFWKVSGVFS